MLIAYIESIVQFCMVCHQQCELTIILNYNLCIIINILVYLT
jgi:hypothetical protein